MPNVMTNPTAFNRAQSAYVPRMMYSADVNYNGGTRVDFGLPAAASATAILNAGSIATAGTSDLSGVVQLPEPYGRTITAVLSGAGTPTVTVNGWDYLGQPISEQFTMTGATPVVGKKAFKSFRSASFGAVGATTMNIGTGASLGLPYKALRCQFETAGGVLAAAGTLTAAVLTTQTATTGDPRGTYTPTTALAGVWITAVFDFANDVDSSGVGGLHGYPHFAA